MRNLQHIWRYFRSTTAVVIFTVAASVQADNPRYDYTPNVTGPVRVLPPINGLGLTNVNYKNGETWQALVCDEKCSLHSVVLNVRSEVLLKYFNTTVTGYRLTIASQLKGEQVALFHGLPAGKGDNSLKTLLHRGMKSYPGSGRPGSLEIGIPPLGTDNLRIVPRLQRGNKEIRVYLESDARRQVLGELHVVDIGGGSLGESVSGRNLLRWAGDLDGDGKLDLVMRFEDWVGNDTSVILFLSSLAKPGDFVGRAGSFFLAGQYD